MYPTPYIEEDRLSKKAEVGRAVKRRHENEGGNSRSGIDLGEVESGE
jgi:hypothetical protein